MQLQVILVQKDEYQPAIRGERENNNESNVAIHMTTSVRAMEWCNSCCNSRCKNNRTGSLGCHIPRSCVHV